MKEYLSCVSKKKRIKPKLYLGRQWHSRVKESYETTWLGGKRSKILCVHWVSHPDPWDLMLVPELPKLKCRLPCTLFWATYQLTCRISHRDPKSKWQFHVIHMHVCHMSFSPGLLPNWVLALAFVLGLCSGIWISFHLVVMSGTWLVDCKWPSLQLPCISRILSMQSLTYIHWKTMYTYFPNKFSNFSWAWAKPSYLISSNLSIFNILRTS